MIGIRTTTPQHLVHVFCECGKELTIQGEGWKVKGDVQFICPCGIITNAELKEIK